MDFLEPDIPVNEDINDCVVNFTEAIVRAAKKKNNLVHIEVNYEEALKLGESEKSIKSSISTEYGLVCVYPDFKNNSAKALIINRGLIHSMTLEGFDAKKINESKVYGSPFEFSEEIVKVFGAYLTQDFGMQHQRGWEPEESSI